MAAQGSETINLETLDVQQLSQVKKQLEEELEHLTSSFAQLHSAQAKFRECLRCVKARPGSEQAERSVLVPLTNSLYVRGELSDPKHVIVDVGTGFYVEKDTESAERFYDAKVQQLQSNIQDLEIIVQRKTSNVRSVEDVLSFFSSSVFSFSLRPPILHDAFEKLENHCAPGAASSHVRNYADKIVQVPQMAESISEGTLKQWSKQIGDFVEQDEEIATIETDKASCVIKEFLVNEEDTVTVGQDIVKLELGGEKPSSSSEDPSEGKTTSDKPAAEPESQPEPSKSESKPEPKDEPQPESKPAAPPAKETKETSKPVPSPSKDTASSTGQSLGSREERRVKMNRMRLRIAERLKQSQNTAASLTTFNEVDMSSLIEFRKLYRDDVLKKTGVKLGFMSAFSRACVLAMRDIPAVNASIEGPNGGDTIVYRDYVDISVAVATEKGLVTPVVRNTESLDMLGIEKAIADMGKKARDNKLTIEDMAGGTFTISNGGVFGSLMGTPIINLPQTAVLGLHAVKERPVAVNGKIEVRPMMYLALTYDHRLLDGREAVQFLVKVKEYIEDPRRMLL
ncbi:2-oxoacid dehydrogenases acyltransferase [Colletotrichum sp. SAR 10_99]|nr:2-oxoacid dehydrogenases acyltransferase [Colletotrichum sp. SAR 10_96]KAJ5016197.1 2-oxoacid dehydrogenases acyltransferase [Colletotrichum sp. SAR 10_99]